MKEFILLLEFEKKLTSFPENPNDRPFRKFLTHNHINISAETWQKIAVNSNFSLSKSAYYLINQYLKYYIWMKSMIIIGKNNTLKFIGTEKNVFNEDIAQKLLPIMLKQETSINSLMEGIFTKSFNQFIIEVDKVFAYPIQINEDAKMKAITQKKSLINIFKLKGIHKFRKSIIRDKLVNKIYLSVLNDFIIRSIYPEVHSEILAKEEAQLPIEMQISNEILNSIIDNNK